MIAFNLGGIQCLVMQMAAKIPHFIFHLLSGSYELTQFTHYIFLVTGIRILGASYPQNGESFRQPPATIQSIERRHQFALRQVTRSAEYNNH